MAMRVSGLISGLDTDSLVQQLTAKYSAQKDKVWKTKESLKIKQDTWKDLNKEINIFANNTLSNLRFTSSYAQNNISLSNSKVADVSGKVSSQQNLVVKQTATNTYLTGGKVERSYPIGIDSKITVTMGGVDKEVVITSDMSMDQVAKALNDVGLAANFDEKNGRLFLASKTTGINSNFTISGDGATLNTLGLGSSATQQIGQDAIISLNGVDFISDKNNFEINDMKITALEAGTTSVTIQENSKIFDQVKDFIDKYNELIKKIDKLYGTKKDKYEPLTDDEKYNLSDKQVEDWEEKVKSSILYKDETLGSVGNILKSGMRESYKINDKYYSLYRLGISTGNYFSTSEEERNIYNIDEEKLKNAIAEDPNSVISFISKLSAKMYDDLGKKMKSSSYNSAYSLYSDKQYKKDLATYEDKIKKMEKELAEREDKLYSKFSRMEAALSKLQTQGNSFAQYFGL